MNFVKTIDFYLFFSKKKTLKRLNLLTCNLFNVITFDNNVLNFKV